MKSKRDRQNHAGDSFWTSYSDLFLGMSVIFLLLYVTASLRNGTDGITQALENQKLKSEVEDLRTQIKAYDSIRKDYLNQTASPEEGKAYEELIDKLSLLQEEARDEREKLSQAAKDQNQKERALNQYQQLVRNIINANVMAKTKIQTRENVIGEQDTDIQAKGQKITALEQDVNEKQEQLSEIEEQLDSKMAQLKSALKRNKLTKKAYEAQVAALKQQTESEAEELKEAIDHAQGQLTKVSKTLQEKAAETARLKGEKESLSGQNQALTGELSKARAEADARRAVARDIKAAFNKAGVKADVNERTGEVELSFGQVYFDNDSANLKAQMKEILKKAMPAYSQSLLGNPKVAPKISSVEIIGFASPTYQGKYVDPGNLDPAARKAVDYNLDLSYNRARSLFKYVFDEKNMKFPFQKNMLPLIKVTGRSFLAEDSRGPANKAGDCAGHDCRKAQKVIIRFNFDDKNKGVAP